MGKVEVLSEFHIWQIVMARRLEASISETVWLVGCSSSIVISIYKKWINDGEDKVLDVRVSLKKKNLEAVLHGKAKSAPERGWQPNIMQVLEHAFPSTHFSGYCWIKDCAANFSLVCLCSLSVNINYTYSRPGNINTVLWMNEIVRVRWITISHSSHRWSCQGTPGEQLLPPILV